MIGIELTRFDQTAVLLSSFSVFALIRERKALPFLLSLVGALFQGPAISCVIAALVAWHRMDRDCNKWIQIKDFAGLFFILAGTVAVDPEQALFSWFGVFLVSVNFGGSALGTLPALLFLRQYHPSPQFLEIALVGHALYWILVEISRWTKIPSGHLVLSWAELLGVMLVLSSFKNEMEMILTVPTLAAAGGSMLVLVLSVFLWIQFRPENFLTFYKGLRPRMVSVLFWGGRWISGREPWAEEELERSEAGFEGALNGLFWWILGLMFTSLVVGIFSRGVGV
jgi:hypothetical protein